jgi:MFS family permease
VNPQVNTAGARPLSIYYGWWVLLATAVTEMLAIGSTSYAAGLFVLPLEQELHLSRADSSSSIPILFAGGAIAAPLVGYALDRFPVQWVMSLGAALLCAGFMIVASTSSPLTMALALFVPAAAGFIAIGPLTTTTLTSRWFYRRRGRAFGIAAVATSGGGFLVVPLLSLAITNYGWRAALFGEAIVIALTVAALALWVVRNGPADVNLESHPENAGRPQAELRAARADAVWSHGRILSNWNFWTIGFVLAAISGINQALVITVVPYGAGLGFSLSSTALFISGFSITAAVTKVASGALADYFDRRLIMVFSTAMMLLSLLLLAGSQAYAALFAASCLAGLALGCMLPSSSALVAACFGSPSFGTVMGWMYVGVGVASIVLVRFIGTMFDRTGGYNAAFLTFAALAGLATLAALLVRVPRA